MYRKGNERFVLIKCDDDCKCSILGQFVTIDEAQKIISTDKLLLVDEDDLQYTYYSIVDCKKLHAFFYNLLILAR